MAASYKRFAGGSDIWTCKQTCFSSSNGREQQVGTKTAQCGHFTPGSSKTSEFAIPCFTLRSPRSGHAAVLRFAKVPAMAACTIMFKTDSYRAQNMREGPTRCVYKSSPRINTCIERTLNAGTFRDTDMYSFPCFGRFADMARQTLAALFESFADMARQTLAALFESFAIRSNAPDNVSSFFFLFVFLYFPRLWLAFTPSPLIGNKHAMGCVIK